MDVDSRMIDPALSDSTMDLIPSAHANAPVDDDDDPIVASYNVFLKPSLPAHRRVMILEHPNKSDGKKMARAPLEIRMKTKTGMVEVDYPIDYNAFYDRSKGLNWGTNLQKSTEAKKGGTHGLAGGFGVGAPPPRARPGRAQDEVFDPSTDWAEALRKDYVLRTQTLGGQMPDISQESKYMVGVFSGPNLHLTPATSLIHLRPQLHHIDATTEQERLAATRGGGGGGGAGAAAATKDVARAIHMTVKQNTDGSEEIVQETMADRLKKVQLEAWKKMRYVHEEASDSWAVAEEALYLHQPEPADREAGAKGKEPADTGPLSQPGLPGLVDKVARLRTAWDEDSMLETTSGIARPQNVKIEISDDEPAGAASRPPKGKGKTPATTTATKATPRGKRATNTNTAKAGSSKSKKNV
ncbi:putative dna-directed rna polymerase iii complex subunit rpc37 [Diaporthe ampelina]|uniref:Putative dna-directed rna polymerase iii complex subunit rpc37 n=1 Tax=Diaporthe ampelina TaxID=1214573 RepID=A0A0G2F9P1_9PEZI|nr:putative dna-directed rna polymerase iii complex subunit rpc37 [Diaporthe ampelina]